WTTTAAGAIDHEYIYGEGGYWNMVQAYSVRLKYVNYFDVMVLQECATASDLLRVASGMYNGLDAQTLNLTSNFAGGTLNYSTFQRGNAPGSSDHA
ncbi:hypothetical protein JZU69_02655, partial [bacterium]|nr:hypothetical protein [bacterium]